VLVVSQRLVEHQVANALQYEFEDVLARCLGADVVCVRSYRGAARYDLPRLAGQLSTRAGGAGAGAVRWLTSRAGGCGAPAPRYDLVVVSVTRVFDLSLVRVLGDARRLGGRVVAVVFEAWPEELEGRAARLEPFADYDALYVAVRPAVDALASLSGLPTRLLPVGVDVLRAAPRSLTRQRGIWVVNPGRRSPGQHQALLRLAEDGDRFYLFDTVHGRAVIDWREHRDLYQRILRLSRFVIANPAKFDRLEGGGDGSELSSRLVEAAAGGAVIVGRPPSRRSLEAAGLGGLPIHAVALDGSDLPEVLAELERVDLTAERAALVELAATRGDWAHRICDLLGDQGLGWAAGLRARLRALEDLAGRLHGPGP
jgi:hypothetical protein